MVNEVQVGRFNGILHKLFSMKEGAPSPTLAPDIIPVLPLEVDRPEWAFLGGVRLGGGGTRVGPVAGQLPQLQLYNPAGSNTLVVVTKVIVSSATAVAATEIRTGFGRAPLASSSGNLGPRDGRNAPLVGVIPTTAQLRLTTAVAVPSIFFPLAFIILPANPFPLELEPNVILDPDSGYTVFSSLANSDLAVGFEWYERSLEASEVR